MCLGGVSVSVGLLLHLHLHLLSLLETCVCKFVSEGRFGEFVASVTRVRLQWMGGGNMLSDVMASGGGAGVEVGKTKQPFAVCFACCFR